MFVKTVGSFLEKNNNHPNNMKIFMMNIEEIVPIFLPKFNINTLSIGINL